MKVNVVMLGDSYKYGHAFQYPKNMVFMQDYLTARRVQDNNGEVIFVGLQYILKEYLSQKITIEMIEEAKEFADLHGISFPYEGWKYIAEELDGKLPIKIKALPEGTAVPAQIPMVLIESTDKKVPWVVGFVETLLMKVWYPTTVATKSKEVYDMLCKYGDPEWAKFAYHNFGDRSMTSVESAAISGFAHNTIFLGTDNFHSLKFCRDYYHEKISSYSVFATEHSTTTANASIDGEEEFVYRMLLENPNAPIMSFVADSYDVFKFTDMVTNPSGKIRKLLSERPNQKLVIRPDSGDPIEVLGKMLKIMLVNGVFDQFSNSKYFSSKYGILWGDGINKDTIKNILETFTVKGYKDLPLIAAETFVFGSGTYIGQTGLTRDTYSFACKCSYIETLENNEIKGHDVFKDPITDSGKKSLKGYLEVYKDKNGKLICLQNPIPGIDDKNLIPAMETVFLNGKIQKEYSLEDIRKKI